jgi:hypothetical protein
MEKKKKKYIYIYILFQKFSIWFFLLLSGKRIRMHIGLKFQGTILEPNAIWKIDMCI